MKWPVIWGFVALMANQKAVQGKESDCILNGKELSALLPDKTESFRSKVSRSRQKHGLVERVRLRSGLRLKVTQGGCAHYGVTFEFAGVINEVKLTDRKHYLEWMATLLESLPNRGEAGVASDLARSARAAIKDIPRANIADAKNVVVMWGECSEKQCTSEYSCGDATCSVTAKRTGKTVVLSAVYDFPL